MDALADVRERLSMVRDPELGATLGELGMLGSLTQVEGTLVVEVALTTRGCPLRARIESDVRAAAEDGGFESVEVRYHEMDPTAKAALMSKARSLAQERHATGNVNSRTSVLMIASAKGGVGKSSIAAGLALALAESGAVVGVLDADIWGFSLAEMLGVSEHVVARDAKMIPVERRVASGSLRLLSMGLLAEEGALLWRGLVVQKAVAQFIEDADWSGCDYLIIDTPPGTGDIHMTLARLLPQMGQILVTTPSQSAATVAARAGDFARKSHLRVLGVVENMSPFTCAAGERHAPFGEGGGQRVADALGVELLCQIPLQDDLESVDGYATTTAIRELTSLVAKRYGPVDLSGCSARLLERVEAAVADLP